MLQRLSATCRTASLRAHLFTSRLVAMPVEIDTVKEGNGEKPKPGQRVECHYVLTLENGKKVDSSRDRGKTFSFKLGAGEVIKGWEEGIARMSKGERANLKISSDLGYGPKGIPGTIPPDATLCFDVELISFK